MCAYPWRALLREERGAHALTQCGCIVWQQLIINRSLSSHFIAFPVLLIKKIHRFSPSWFNRGSLAASMNMALLWAPVTGPPQTPVSIPETEVRWLPCQTQHWTECSMLASPLTSVCWSHLPFNQKRFYFLIRFLRG